MLTEYIHHFADRLNSRNVMDHLQAATSSREGLFGISAAVALIAGTTYYHATKIDRGVPQVPASGIFGSSTDEYRVSPPAFIEKWRTKLGVPVYGAQLFGQHATIVSGVAVREIFMNDDFSFVKGMQRSMHVALLTNTYSMDVSVLSGGIKRYLSPNLKHFTKRVIEHLEIGLEQKIGTVPRKSACVST
ncbi:hypothetical protein BC940DRAFT_85624 [Gongronella butleri]|nr:hypothetical protein BC940DRAFT_85624 [Gongronella butleri]